MPWHTLGEEWAWSRVSYNLPRRALGLAEVGGTVTSFLDTATIPAVGSLPRLLFLASPKSFCQKEPRAQCPQGSDDVILWGILPHPERTPDPRREDTLDKGHPGPCSLCFGIAYGHNDILCIERMLQVP